MNRIHRLPVRLVLLIGLLALAPGLAGAQELYTYTVSLLGGAGGSVDADPGDSLDNLGYQVNLSVVTEPRTHVGLRIGQLDIDPGGEGFGPFSRADLTYATVAGEYRNRQSYYESGLYFGLGAYRLEESGLDVDDFDETSIGGVIGVTGEFKINRHLGVLVEFSGHYVDFDAAQIFGMGHAGVAIHF